MERVDELQDESLERVKTSGDDADAVINAAQLC